MYNYAERRAWKDQKIKNERATVKAICLYLVLSLVTFLCIDKVMFVYSLTYNPVSIMEDHDIAFKSINEIDPNEVLNIEEHQKMLQPVYSYNIEPKEIYQYYKDKGYNDAAIAGILANIEVESNFNTKERTVQLNEFGDVVGGLGIYQWNGIRTEMLKNWAWNNGFDYENPFVQMAFMLKEAESYNVMPEQMNFNNSEWGAANAAYHFAASFEKCSSKFIRKRTDKAVKWFNIIQTQYSMPEFNMQLALNY